MKALTCSECKCGFWSFNTRGPDPLRCEKCTRARKRQQGANRQRARRGSKGGAKRKTTPASRSRRGGSISEGDLTVPHSSKARKSAKPISRVAEGREGRGNPSLADRALPPLETLAEHNRKLYTQVLRELRAIAERQTKTPEPVIHGSNHGKK